MSDTETNRRRLYTTLKTERGGGESYMYKRIRFKLSSTRRIKKTDKREMKKRLAAV